MRSVRGSFVRGTILPCNSALRTPHSALAPVDDDSLNELRMRNESYNPLLLIYDDDRRPDMRVRLFQLLDLESRQLRLGGDDHRIAPGVHLRGALLGIVPRSDALRDDVAVGDSAEVAAGLWGVSHRPDRVGLRRHPPRHL